MISAIEHSGYEAEEDKLLNMFFYDGASRKDTFINKKNKGLISGVIALYILNNSIEGDDEKIGVNRSIKIISYALKNNKYKISMDYESVDSVKKIWNEFKTVSHLWAAKLYLTSIVGNKIEQNIDILKGWVCLYSELILKSLINANVDIKIGNQQISESNMYRTIDIISEDDVLLYVPSPAPDMLNEFKKAEAKNDENNKKK